MDTKSKQQTSWFDPLMDIGEWSLVDLVLIEDEFVHAAEHWAVNRQQEQTVKVPPVFSWYMQEI